MKKKTATKKEVTQKKFYTTYIPGLDETITDVLNSSSFAGLPTSNKELEEEAVCNKLEDPTLTHYYEVEVVVNISGPKKIPEPANKKEQTAPKIIW